MIIIYALKDDGSIYYKKTCGEAAGSINAIRRYIVTLHGNMKYELCQFNLRDNDLCENCQIMEDIAHLLFDCPLSFAIWESLKTWITATTNKTYHFD